MIKPNSTRKEARATDSQSQLPGWIDSKSGPNVEVLLIEKSGELLLIEKSGEL